MKLGCCLNMLSSGSDSIGIKYLDVLQKNGYDYVELPLAQIMELDEEQFNKLIYHLEKASITCECCNNFIPSNLRLTGREVSKEKIENYLEKAFFRLKELGTEIVVFGSSGAKNVPKDFPVEQAFDQIVDFLRLVSRYAKETGITIAIEPLNRMESNIIINLTDGIKLLETVDRSNIRLLVDYYHFAIEMEQLEVLQKAMKYIVHVHFSDPEKRKYPSILKEEYLKFIHVLKNANYSGRISSEAFSDRPEDDLERFKNMFTPIINN